MACSNLEINCIFVHGFIKLLLLAPSKARNPSNNEVQIYRTDWFSFTACMAKYKLKTGYKDTFYPTENCLISGLFLYAIHCMIWFWGRTAINRIILISGVIITGFQCVSYHYAELAVFRAICDGLKGHSL